MTQQINLYQSAVIVKTSPLAARRLLSVVIVCFGLLLLGYGASRWQLWRLESHLADVKVQSQAAQEAQLKVEKAVRLPLLTLLAGHSPDEFPGFSECLRGLASEDLDGVWLRDITLAEGGHSLVLQGSALRAELVPRYVQRLSRQASFAGLEFASLVMSRSEERKESVDFVLRSTLEEAQ